MRSKTVALGIGSNLQNPIRNLRQALSEIKKSSVFEVVRVSSIYESDAQLPDNSSVDWNKKFLNAVVLCRVSESVSAEGLLHEIKNIEVIMGRESSERWAPRLIDIDILYWCSENHHSDKISIPHARLRERPFALLPLMEVWPYLKLKLPDWSDQFIETKPFNTRVSQKYFWPKMVGILNITKDSFSDGGQYLNLENLQSRYHKLIDQGAEIIDIGAESTRPGAQAVSEQQELENLSWALGELKNPIDISLDSRHPHVVSRILEKYKINYLNDVTGFSDSQMKSILKESKLPAFVMHSLSIPPRADQILNESQNPCEQLIFWWKNKLNELVNYGVNSENLIFDPGIGFGKSKLQNMYILKQLEQFSEIKNSIMIAHSRKSFLLLLSDRPAGQRDLETALITKDLNLAYVQYLRVHDIESQMIALRAGAK